MGKKEEKPKVPDGIQSKNRRAGNKKNHSEQSRSKSPILDNLQLDKIKEEDDGRIKKNNGAHHPRNSRR
jgi:hypothetical protein